MKPSKPSKEAFYRYLDVQNSGVTNMFAVSVVCELADLTKTEYMYILKHYSELVEEYKSEVL